MIGASAQLKGNEQVVTMLRGIVGRAKSPTDILGKLGRRYVSDETPAIFSEGGPPEKKWKRVLRDGRSADPLMDVGTLQKSVQFKVENDELIVGVPSASPAGKYARLHQFGGTFGPTSSQWLLIPQSPPLTPSQRRAGGFRALFPDAFFLFKGPEGPGLYRKTRRGVVGYTLGPGRAKKVYGSTPHMIERIAAAVKSVTVKERPFLVWTQRFLDKALVLVKRWLAEGS